MPYLTRLLLACMVMLAIGSTANAADISVSPTCTIDNAIRSASLNEALGGCTSGSTSEDVILLPLGAVQTTASSISGNVTLRGKGTGSTTLAFPSGAMSVTSNATITFEDMTIEAGTFLSNLTAQQFLTFRRVDLIGSGAGTVAFPADGAARLDLVDVLVRGFTTGLRCGTNCKASLINATFINVTTAVSASGEGGRVHISSSTIFGGSTAISVTAPAQVFLHSSLLNANTLVGSITSTGFNLIRTVGAATITATTGDLFNLSPGTLTVVDNVVRFGASSPAVDGGDCTAVGGNLSTVIVTVDTVGTPRPQGVACDIGAFELIHPAVLVDVTDAGAACPEGGIRLRTGKDDNFDNVLATSEIDRDSLICNGLEILVSATPLDAGGACAAGGFAIASGNDDNSNGTLEVGEIESTSNVCNGVGSLVVTSVLALDSVACPAGGVRIDVGSDTNGDGSLAAGEIDTTSTICNGFSVLVTTAAVVGGVCGAANGQRINAGRDDGQGNGVAGDGVLHPDEVDTTATVCNGAAGSNGANALVTSTAVATAAGCPASAQRLDIGRDLDNDNTLDANEITQNSFICNGAAGATG